MAGFAEWSNNKKQQSGVQPIATPTTAKSFTQWSNDKKGIVTPQTYRNQNTAFENSGLSRDDFDSSVRQNYAARAAASTPTLKTSGGYYSQPQNIGADMERYSNTVSVYETDLQKKRKAVEDSYAELERLQGELTTAGGKMESLHSFAQSSTIAAGLFQQAQRDYLDVLGKYEAAAQKADAAYSEYEPSYNRYVEAVNAYETYRTEQQGIYDSWKGTIRDADAIQTEIGGVDAQIEALEQQKARDAQAVHTFSDPAPSPNS